MKMDKKTISLHPIINIYRSTDPGVKELVAVFDKKHNHWIHIIDENHLKEIIKLYESRGENILMADDPWGKGIDINDQQLKDIDTIYAKTY